MECPSSYSPHTSKDCGVEGRQEEPSSSVYSKATLSQANCPTLQLQVPRRRKPASVTAAPSRRPTLGSPEVEGLKVAKEDELEAVYEEVDWVTLEHMPVPPKSRGSVARQVESVRRVPFQLALASLQEDRSAVRAELSAWLGSQASALDQQVGLIEVFTSKAPLDVVSLGA